MPTTSSTTSASPASACSPAGAARTATQHGSGAPNPEPARALHRQRLLLAHELAGERALLQDANRDYLEWAAAMGFVDNAEPIVLQLYCETLQKFRLAARGPRRACSRPSAPRARSTTYFDPLPIWYAPFEERGGRRRTPSRCTRSPSGRWPCTTPGARRTPGCGRSTASNRLLHASAHRRARSASPMTTGSGSTSHHGRIKVQVEADGGRQPRHGVDLERDRQARAAPGTWRPTRRRRKRGFLLNHLISDLLPARRRRPALRQRRSGDRPGRLVRPARAHRARRAAEDGATEPQFAVAAAAAGIAPAPPTALRYGARFRSARARQPNDQPAEPPAARSSASSSTSTPASAATPARSTARSGTPAASRRR